MRIGLVILNAGRGGHTRTALTLANELHRRGHTVTFLVGNQSDPALIEASVHEFVTVNHGIRSELPRKLRQLKQSPGLDAIQCFSSLGLCESLLTARALKVSCIYTRSGGPPASDPFETTMLRQLQPPVAVSLSAEGKVDCQERLHWRDTNILVLAARLDIAGLEALQDPALIQAFRQKYNVPEGRAVLLRVARVGTAYERSIREGALAVAELNRRGVPSTFVHLGHVDLSASFEALKALLATLNEGQNVPIAITAQDEAIEGAKYMSLADAALGAGRSAFEAMGLRKPTMVVGVRGYAGIVSPDEVDAIAFTNFSGRNQSADLSEAESVGRLADRLQTLFTDPAERKRFGDYARSYAEQNLDIATAASVYEELYRKPYMTGQPNLGNLRRAFAIASIKRSLRAYMGRELRGKFSSWAVYKRTPKSTEP